MDKIFSTRLDESVIHRIDALSQMLGTSKKAVVESAIGMYAYQMEQDKNYDIFEHTCGAWQRDESPAETVESIRNAFRDSMNRYRR